MVCRFLQLLCLLCIVSASSAFAQSNCTYNVGANDGCTTIYVFDQNYTWTNYTVNFCVGQNNYCSSPTTVNTSGNGGAYFQAGAGVWYTIWPTGSPCYVNYNPVYNQYSEFYFNYFGTGSTWGAKAPYPPSPGTFEVMGTCHSY